MNSLFLANRALAHLKSIHIEINPDTPKGQDAFLRFQYAREFELKNIERLLEKEFDIEEGYMEFDPKGPGMIAVGLMIDRLTKILEEAKGLKIS